MPLFLLRGTNTYEQNCQSSESKLSLLGVCRVVKVVDEVNFPLPTQTSRPPEAVASSVYPTALSSFGRLWGMNT